MASPVIVPPPGYKLDVPTPPPGYQLDNTPDYSRVPAFLKQGLDMSKVQQVPAHPQTMEDRNSVAYVSEDDPYKIQIQDPGNYGPPTLNHELVHTFQDTRNPDLPPISKDISGDPSKDYKYGWLTGLEKAKQQGKTIADFNYEQQADMVKDYKIYHDLYLQRAKEGAITPQEERMMYRFQQAYHPFVQQLANMPDNKEKLQKSPLKELLGLEKPPTIDTHPAPPGLPRYDTPGLGMLPADPLMGGESQPTPVPKKKTK